MRTELAHPYSDSALDEVNTERRTRPFRLVFWVLTLALLILIGLSHSGPARADTDTDFAAQLQTYGVYGQRDYNAWLGKVACTRLATNVDHSAFDTATFLSTNLQHSTTQQTWQFLSRAVATYCPDQTPTLSSAATPHA
ncbi:DUF732 domain-containing protein [Mycolicibacterium chlorophenolicum]|uniref:DUF732 domain-containing protein n=1 Tax=Mycolicibacterium chlorophenolicum TaxID=37916 RepID=A0A0J6WM35_9MYCO|nr:DUF732 domain-containing protein [Mycolicibacterium chlorophenolicum]KMO83654.1 hypothetical protein MCHLDSM_00306 [Mycolicibacterium chlorophenolicum]